MTKPITGSEILQAIRDYVPPEFDGSEKRSEKGSEMDMIDVYVAIPYSDPDTHKRFARCILATAYAAHLIRLGKTVHSPITHSHAIAQMGDLPLHYDFWRITDQVHIRSYKEIHVIMADGWKDSVGVRAEIEYGIEQGKDIRYVEPETWEVK